MRTYVHNVIRVAVPCEILYGDSRTAVLLFCCCVYILEVHTHGPPPPYKQATEQSRHTQIEGGAPIEGPSHLKENSTHRDGLEIENIRFLSMLSTGVIKLVYRQC